VQAHVTSDIRDVPRLADFIHDHRDRILGEWAAAVRALPIARTLTRPHLLDHLPQLLDRISTVVRRRHDGAPPALADLPRVHALDRLDHGFALGEVADEYALLRRCVLEAYGRRNGPSIEPCARRSTAMGASATASSSASIV
jgi:hypothetical protein